MFYSQFILAKKGPLGTIWIAAHLERKLRKNQVADTDIGVSVDSILFPDVPIALRLSSHLLLGVVRIYSRKVNYLFDDCSDTLLKIKQAFRSTAVDLPPEESTAPYHSITLPETFDLDDFELPDIDVFQGNYVDHHISSKEQITLQDTMDGVVYSTSQFGLDERFGDGDTSQIGLDLVEELFLDKLGHGGDAGVMLNSDADPQTSFQPITPFEEGGENNETSQAMTAAGRGNQDYAVAPSTPCLVEEPNLCNVQKVIACNNHLETENHNSVDLEAIENVGTDVGKSHHHEDNLDLQMTLDAVPLEENGYDHCGEAIQHLKPKGDLLTASENVKHLQNGGLSNKEVNVESSPSSCQEASKEDNCQKPCPAVENMAVKFSSSNTRLTEPEGIPAGDQALQTDVINNIEVSQNVEESCTPTNLFLPIEPAETEANVEDQACYKPKDCKTLDPDEDMASPGVHILQRCKSDLNQSQKISFGDGSVIPSDVTDAVDNPCSMEISELDEATIASGISAEMPGEHCHPITAVKPFVEGKWTPEPNPSEDIDRSNVDAVSKDTLNFPNSSAVSELPAPEKLLSMPEVPCSLLNDFLFEITPDKTVSIESEGESTESRRNQGKKRSFTEITLTHQSLNIDESFARTQLKQTGEFIPEDDDLLSSILVGRKSSILKMKTTPIPTELAPMKRPRITPRASASKRKVLMDDSMVLHGDTIRQQLTSTEDIRRVRKKAPATRHEVWIIQKQFLEDEVFTEPISTGMSIELIGLHSETYDLSSIIISIDENISALDSAKDTDPTARPNVMKGNETEGSTETCLIRIDEETQPAGIFAHDENQQGANSSLGSRETEAQLQVGDISADIKVKTSNHEHGEMEVDGASVEVADEAGCTASHGVEYSCPTGPVSDAPLSDDKDDSVLGLCNGQGINGGHSGENPSDNILEIETGSGARGEHLLKETEDYKDLEGRGESFTSSSWPTGNAEPSITTPLETGMCQDLIVVSNQSMEEIASDVPEFVKEHEDVATEFEFDDKNKAGDMCCEEPRANSSYLTESDAQNNSLNCGVTSLFMDMERPVFLEAEVPAGVMDLETSGLNHSLVEDHGELGTNMCELDTEFLNVDDDDAAEDEDYIPSAEETRLLENSGWSSRSRAVAKYLQTLFDKETEVGKKIIPMDNLLSGKTRKEASRMFFETLVLKTRDYIHVEQPTPFNNIYINPRGKLLKTDF